MFFTACTSEVDQKAMSEMANLFHAERVAIGSEKGMGSFKGEFKTITLSGGDLLNNPHIEDNNILSMGALAFLDAWNAEDKNGYKNLKIKLERTVNGSLRKVEAIYAFDTLEMIKNNIKECIKVGNAFASRNYEEVYKQLYFDIKENISAQDFKSQLNEVDSVFGAVKAFKVTRFSTYSATQKDGTDLPIATYTMEVNRDSFISNINFKYSLLKKQEGLLDLNIE